MKGAAAYVMEPFQINCADLPARSARGEKLPQPEPGKMACGINVNPGRINAGAQPIDRFALILY